MATVRSLSDITAAMEHARTQARYATPTEMARAAGLEPGTVRAWLQKSSGDVGLISFARAANACGVSVDSLVFGETAADLTALDASLDFSGVTADQTADLTESVRVMTDICRAFNRLPHDGERLHPARVLLNFIRECRALAASLGAPSPAPEFAGSPPAAPAPSAGSPSAAQQAASRMRTNSESEGDSVSRRAARKSTRRNEPPRS